MNLPLPPSPHPFLLALFLSMFQKSNGVGCFRCRSVNKSDPHCRDTFNSSEVEYVEKCDSYRHSHHGLFPGHFCFKINGVSLEGGEEEIYHRDCTTENMGSMCGQFRLEGQLWSGCVQTCRLDGCNPSSPIIRPRFLFLSLLLLSHICIVRHNSILHSF